MPDDPAKPWQIHTHRFVSRALTVGATTFEFLHPYLDQLPTPPLEVQFSDRTAVKYQLCLLVIGSLRSAREVAFSSSKLWLQGHFLLSTVGIRMMVELYGQLAWAEQKVLSHLESGEWEVAFDRMKKLLLGANSAIPLIRGEFGPHPLINVMEFVRAADARTPGTADSYAFLCDSAHPTYMLHSWLLFAGPDHDNWSNATFAAEADAILDRVLQTAESCVAQIETVADVILARCLPAISAEAKPE